MKKHSLLAAAIAGACVLSTAPAWAERESVSVTGPNRNLLHSGIFALGVPYVASVIVASTNDRSDDDKLYIPVAGPWMDLANRNACGNAGQPSCDAETAYKILLIGNGILQGVGALEIVGAFIFPETRTVTAAKPEAPRFRFSPYYAGTGNYGLSAFATF
jgi:hypothetical protein